MLLVVKYALSDVSDMHHPSSYGQYYPTKAVQHFQAKHLQFQNLNKCTNSLCWPPAYHISLTKTSQLTHVSWQHLLLRAGT